MTAARKDAAVAAAGHLVVVASLRPLRVELLQFVAQRACPMGRPLSLGTASARCLQSKRSQASWAPQPRARDRYAGCASRSTMLHLLESASEGQARSGDDRHGWGQRTRCGSGLLQLATHAAREGSISDVHDWSGRAVPARSTALQADVYCKIATSTSVSEPNLATTVKTRIAGVLF
jgi:hypothetical protein